MDGCILIPLNNTNYIGTKELWIEEWYSLIDERSPPNKADLFVQLYMFLLESLEGEKGFFHNRDMLLRDINDLYVLYDVRSEYISGFCLASCSNSRYTIHIIQSFDTFGGCGRFMIDKFKSTGKAICASNCFEESCGFWEAMGFTRDQQDGSKIIDYLYPANPDIRIIKEPVVQTQSTIRLRSK